MLATLDTGRYTTRTRGRYIRHPRYERLFGARAMSLASSSSLPTEPDQLAGIVTAPGEPAERRNRAMAQLLPQITAVARQVAAGLPRRKRDDFVAHAGAIIWSRLARFHQTKGEFDAWCLTVLHNHAIDQWRRESKGCVLPPVGGDEDATVRCAKAEPDDRCGTNGSGGVDEWSEDDLDGISSACQDELARLRELRSILDRIAWEPASSRGMHYFAVLLLQLRLAIARRFSTVVPEATANRPVQLAELIEWCLPWRGPEAEARIKPDWPRLTEVWPILSGELEQPPYLLEPATLCARLQPVLSGSRPLDTDLWNHWVKRAKDAARDRVADDVVWDRCFRPLLPSRGTGA